MTASAPPPVCGGPNGSAAATGDSATDATATPAINHPKRLGSSHHQLQHPPEVVGADRSGQILDVH